MDGKYLTQEMLGPLYSDVEFLDAMWECLKCEDSFSMRKGVDSEFLKNNLEGVLVVDGREWITFYRLGSPAWHVYQAHCS